MIVQIEFMFLRDTLTMKLEDCKVGIKVWYHPDQTDRTKKIAGVISHSPDYMWGDWACSISTRDLGNESVPQWINICLLSKREES